MKRLSAPIYQLKRRAKRMVREQGLALHEALDRIAIEEGFQHWSLLASRAGGTLTENLTLSLIEEGDLILLGARSRQGKTLLGLRLLLEAANAGRRAVFFTLEYTERETRDRIKVLSQGHPHSAGKVDVIASDDISADTIVMHLDGLPAGTVAVIDYLQILDQQRSKPPLDEQLATLQAVARKRGIGFIFLSQIDRAFEAKAESVPSPRNIRMPNPVDLAIFSKACFLHEGQVSLQTLG